MFTSTIQDLDAQNRAHRMYDALDCEQSAYDTDDPITHVLRVASIIAEWEHVKGILPTNMIR
jgi:hypothetical protein